MSCKHCNWLSELYSSREIEQNNTPGSNPFDINIRTIMAFREIGKGYSALETFLILWYDEYACTYKC